MSLGATLVIPREFDLPLAKLTVCGRIDEFESKESEKKVISDQCIIFVIDRSYSMEGSRLKSIKEALLSFIPTVCEMKNVIIKLVLFCHKTETIDIPSIPSEAIKVLEANLKPTGGTDFHVASQALVTCANDVVTRFPTHQLSVIMCSDGQVGKENASQGHQHWKKWVETTYLRGHGVVPYVSTVGISAAHDADILDGFICEGDNNGTYVFCKDSSSILEAFNTASEDIVMQNNGVKLKIEFPFARTCDKVFNDAITSGGTLGNVGNVGNDQKEEEIDDKLDFFQISEFVVRNDDFIQTFWVSMKELTPQGDGSKSGQFSSDLVLKLNDRIVPIVVKELGKENYGECHGLAIQFYSQMIRDMIHILRNTDATLLQNKARAIEAILSKKSKIFEMLTSDPPEKQELQNEIRKLLTLQNDQEASSKDSNNDEKQDLGDLSDLGSYAKIAARRAELMKKYKEMNKGWVAFRKGIIPFKTDLDALKKLIREIGIGSVRMQELRQHILDLHYKKTHSKRIEKLILTQEQIDSRQAYKQQALNENLPGINEHCKDVSDEQGSGCYLSTLTMKEVVLDGEPLWICGKVDRSGGALVSNPELIRIEYISPDLVSDSYFELALETSPEGFADSSRQIVNARLFPIYANKQHYLCTKPYLSDVLSHTLSGRNDIRVVDYTSLWATIGAVIAQKKGLNLFSSFWLTRLFRDILPSMRLLCGLARVKKYDNHTSREICKTSGGKVTLLERCKTRLENYINYVEARTTALVSNSHVLFCDKMLHFDAVKLDCEFWLSLMLQRLRHVVKNQIPTGPDDTDLQTERLDIHAKCLQILVRGTQDAPLVCVVNENVHAADGETDGKDGGDEKQVEQTGGEVLKMKSEKLLKLAVDNEPSRSDKVFKLPKSFETNRDAFYKNYDGNVSEEYDPKRVDKSMLDMASQILRYIEVRDCIAACHFFDSVGKVGFDQIVNNPAEMDTKSLKMSLDEGVKGLELDLSKNDFYKFCQVIGWKFDINAIRALISIGLVTGMNNSSYREKAPIFANMNESSGKKELFSDPNAVLVELNKVVSANIKHGYEVWLEQKEKDRMFEIHTSPLLPDEVDEFGELPDLRCAWKRCGKEFDNRDRLFAHVARCTQKPLAHRFHLYCKQILEPDPNQSYEDFLKAVRVKFNSTGRKTLMSVNDEKIKAFYDQFTKIYLSK